MKNNLLLVVSITFLALFSFSAFSQDSQFCSQPLKTVCKNSKLHNGLTSQSIKRLKDQIYKEAIKNAKPKIAKLEKQYTDSWHTNNRDKLRYKILNQEIMKSANSRIKGLESVVTNMKSISLIKSYMKMAIDESHFNESTRKSFKKTIDSVMIGNFSDYNMRKGTKDDYSKHKTSPCGLDGMEVNATSTTFNNQKYILLCPGLLINYTQTLNEQEKLNNILFTITHEMGHHLENSKAADKVFIPYISCLVENYSDDLQANQEDKFFCQNIAKNKEECRIKVTVSHAGELIADQWAINVIAIYARTKKYSPTQTDLLLRNNLSKFCGMMDDGIHPSSDFRIETLLRVNPEVSNYLFCNNSKIKKVACTFDGSVNL